MWAFLKWAVIVILAVPVLFFAWVMWMVGPLESPEPREMSQEQQDIAVARRACRSVIEAQLHDPDSAEWGNVSLWPAGLQADDESRILVQPEIRARNAMGGLILTRFQCTFEGSGDSMRLVDLQEY